jgi:hypothetical protein
MLEWIKQLVIYAVLLAVVITGVVFIPRMFSQVAVPGDYNEIAGIEMTTSFSLDPSVSVQRLDVGDGIAWRLPGSDGDEQVGLGWFAGGPGDVVEIDKIGALIVNGTKFTKIGVTAAPPCRLVIPEQSFFAVTTAHQLDSIRHGPLPLSTFRGRVKGLP